MATETNGSGWYIVIQSWMVENLDLEKNELLVYATIFGFSNDGNSWYFGSQAELARRTNSDRATVIRSIESLIKKGLVVKEVVENNGLRFCKYRADVAKCNTVSENATCCKMRHNNKTIYSSEVDIENTTVTSNTNTRENGKRFVPPTIEEVQAYCSENNIRIDAEQFWYYYDSKNWVCGKTKMSRWKSAVRLWERNERKYRNASAPNKPTRREEEPNWL